MKNIYFFIISICCFTSAFAQNYEYEDYHPFPYDSVFFELSTPDEEVFAALMPLVKSDHTDDMLLPINNVAHWVDILKVQGSFGIFPFNVAYKSWLGKLTKKSRYY